jgi:UDP-glucose 4-epimerase
LRVAAQIRRIRQLETAQITRIADRYVSVTVDRQNLVLLNFEEFDRSTTGGGFSNPNEFDDCKPIHTKDQCMKVIVTGGAGFIGSHIVDALIAAGHQPFVIDDFSTGDRKNLPNDVTVFEADVRDKTRIAEIFDQVQPAAVCHQAAQMSVSRSMRDPLFDADVNILGLVNVFENASRVGVRRIVFASSGGVLYGDVNTPAKENHPKKPMSAYGISKWTGEHYLEFYARERGITGVALRYSNVYGPRQNPHGEAGVVAIFATNLIAEKQSTINGDGQYIRDFVFGPDVAQANLMALQVELAEPFSAINIGTGLGTDINELSVMLTVHARNKLKSSADEALNPSFRHGPPRIGDLRSNLIAADLAMELLGWEPQTVLDDGLGQTVDWFANQATG